jgi:hypothetical protein
MSIQRYAAEAGASGAIGMAIFFPHVPWTILLGIPASLYYLGAFFSLPIVRSFFRWMKVKFHE